MSIVARAASVLCLIDFQERLLPAIPDSADTVANASRLMRAADALGVPVVLTEQNPTRLGSTVPDLSHPGDAHQVVTKMSFDARMADGFLDRLRPSHQVVIAGAEAHICVLQTVLGLLDGGWHTYIVTDAVASRRPENRDAALSRLERAGAELVTTEMVIFEWLGSAEDPAFRSVIELVKEVGPRDQR